MKINKLLLLQYLSLISLKGEISNSQVLLNINKDLIKCLTASKDKSTLLRARIKGDFEDLGEIGIADLGYMKKILSAYSEEEVDISLTKNKLTIKSPSLKTNCIQIEPEYVRNTIPEEKFDTVKSTLTTEKISLSAEQVKNITKYFYLNNSAKREDNIINFQLKNKKLTITFKSDNENDIVYTQELENEVSETEFRLGDVFIEVLSTLNSGLELTIGENLIGLELGGESIKLEFLVAHMA